MNKQEIKIANGMLTEIERSHGDQQSTAIFRYQNFLRACIDRRAAEKKRRTARA